jgi:hypothetical protein
MATEPNSLDAYHIAPLTYDEKGVPMAEAPFTSTQDTKRYAVIVPPTKVVPVILIPGIMGSNLRLNALPAGFADKRYTTGATTKWEWPPVQRTTEGWGDRAWRPDDAADFMARRFWSLEAHERRALLDPANTAVDDRADVPNEVLEPFIFDSPADGRDREARADQRRRGFVNEMKRRGWGTVMLTSYGPLLAYLERHLNQMYVRGQLNDFWRSNILARSGGGWGIARGDKPLSAEDVRKAARYWLPVHAVGYNWLQSNRDSAKHVATKVNEFIGHYKKLGYECDRVLFITHSMGGLVARAAVHADMGALSDKVIGVIHGVMPTHGAAAAYRRCRAGFEGAGLTSAAAIAANILGRDGPEVAAVFSNSPGALQLLPSKLYGSNWLRVTDDAGRVLLSLPKADPYTEIYEQRDAWWRLMNPAWLDSRRGASAKHVIAAWNIYLDNLKLASSFHETLGATHHPHTHMQYGADNTDHRAFGTVTWQGPKAPQGLHGNTVASVQFADDPQGTVTLQDVLAVSGRTRTPAVFTLVETQDEAGDGTVPIRSARALNAGAELVAEHAGYEHQGSYQDRRAQELTAYSVVRLVAENMPA